MHLKETTEQNIKDQLFDALRFAIIACEIPPGTEFSERYIAERYDVGKASVRDALSRLGQEGWVASVPRSGHVVTPMSREEVLDIFSMRAIIEPESAARAAGRIGEGELRNLNGACARSYMIDDPAQKRRFLMANRDFHVAVARASGSLRLARSVERLHDESLRVLYLSVSTWDSSEDWARGHEPMIDALARGDANAAYEMTLSGIHRSRDRVLEAFDKSPGLQVNRQVLRAYRRATVTQAPAEPSEQSKTKVRAE